MAKNKVQDAGKSKKIANIVVGIVAGIAALIIIAVIVMCSVRIDPLANIAIPTASAEKGNDQHCDFYDLGSEDPTHTNATAQSKISVALGGMDFSVMTAVLQWNFDYSYNFVRNTKGEKIEMNAGDINGIGATETEYMVEFVYNAAKYNGGELDTESAQKLVVDGETVYFDRMKVVIGDSNGGVGELYLYPYLYKRVTDISEEGGVAFATYRTTAVKVRANTTSAYAALKELAVELSRE